ncbi:endonuclease/exonuclease/phosphatase family protein [Pseudoclavibacter soli]|uniref:endonuclease/exonuclease/phosphatase family protein n=1 Tax=Pseudoclavibacter soli TaxID=452623 RepID=UPI000400A967|nr:endonuclease/exonuclease/phosphatase family protein [Pseudoclavibacter soli]
MFRRLLTALWLLLSLALIATLVWGPAMLGQRIGFAQLLAFPVPAVALLALFGAALLITSVLSGRAVVSTIVCVGLVCAAAVPAHQAVQPSASAWSSDQVGTQTTGTLRILSWNIGARAESLPAVADLAAEVSPQVIALPETNVSEARELSTLLAERGLDFTVVGSSRNNDSAWPTTVLVATQLGAFHLVNDTTQQVRGGIVAVPEDSSLPTIVVAHTQQPGFSESQADVWRSHLNWLGQWCSKGDTVVVGDFNATSANIGDSLGDCAEQTSVAHGALNAGTWPTILPAWMGAAIDRVYTSSSRTIDGFWAISGTSATDSDHRPIVVDVRSS